MHREVALFASPAPLGEGREKVARVDELGPDLGRLRLGGRSAIRRWTFPKPEGGPVEISFPFTFERGT